VEEVVLVDLLECSVFIEVSTSGLLDFLELVGEFLGKSWIILNHLAEIVHQDLNVIWLFTLYRLCGDLSGFFNLEELFNACLVIPLLTAGLERVLIIW